MTAADAARVLAIVAEEQPEACIEVGDSYGDVFWVQLVCPEPLSEGAATAIEAMGAERDCCSVQHWSWRDAELWTL